MSRPIEIVEVGPRDGLQNDPVLLDTAVKLEFIDRLIESGVKRMEVASFVNPKAVPKMADSIEVMAQVPRDRGVSFIGLALNERGMRQAIESRCDEINYVMVASEGFGKANQNATPQDTADLLDRIAVLAHDATIPLSATISVAFGDPFDGEVDPAILGELARRAAAAGAVEIALGDTIGVATPWQVQKAVAIVREAAPKARLRLHFHNTRNTAIANVFAAVEAAVGASDLVVPSPAPSPLLGDIAPAILHARFLLEKRDSNCRFQILPVRSVGVQGDQRTYASPVALINAPRDWDWLESQATRITNEVRTVNRVVLLLRSNTKDSNAQFNFHKAFCSKDRLDLLREADYKATKFFEKHGLMPKIFQLLVILLPVSKNGEEESLVLRPVVSEDVMTAQFARIDWKLIDHLVESLLDISGIENVFYDITHKPPATFGWE